VGREAWDKGKRRACRAEVISHARERRAGLWVCMIFGVAGWAAFGNEFKGKIKKSWWGLQCGIAICDVAICRCGFPPKGRPS